MDKQSLLTPVLGASGVQNYFGEGYWYHRWYKLIPGFSFNGMMFVSKTTTLPSREGNMPLKNDGSTPQEWLPKCIWVNIRKGITLNAVGLSGHGAEALFDRGLWQLRTDPFWISFMSVATTKEERLVEARAFVELLKVRMLGFATPFGVQINGSCPNQKGVTTEEAVAESREMLDIFAELGVPLMYKLSVTTSPEQAKPMTKHPALSALCVSNTVPFGNLGDRIDWIKLFNLPQVAEITKEMSPLWPRVGMAGGLSGPPLFPILVDWVKEARSIGIEIHINAGGGIFSPQDVTRIKNAGADSVSLGSVAMHRPWRVKSIIKQAYTEFGKG